MKKKEEKKEEEEIMYESIEKIPNESIKKKLLQLNTLNSEIHKLDEEYSKEAKKIEMKFRPEYATNRETIQKIIEGEECEIDEEEMKKYKIEKEEKSEKTEIKDYWYKVITNSKYFDIQEKDEPILKLLKKVYITNQENSFNYTVHFYFGENDYFNENELTKTYFFDEDEENICKAIGTKISWKSINKNPTKKLCPKKKNKHSKSSTNQYVDTDSFFNFFNDDLTKSCTASNDENVFFRSDLFVNQLEYYLNIIETSDDFEDFDEHKNKNDNIAMDMTSLIKYIRFFLIFFIFFIIIIIIFIIFIFKKKDNNNTKEECKQQ